MWCINDERECSTYVLNLYYVTGKPINNLNSSRFSTLWSQRIIMKTRGWECSYLVWKPSTRDRSQDSHIGSSSPQLLKVGKSSVVQDFTKISSPILFVCTEKDSMVCRPSPSSSYTDCVFRIVYDVIIKSTVVRMSTVYITVVPWLKSNLVGIWLLLFFLTVCSMRFLFQLKWHPDPFGRVYRETCRTSLYHR